MTRNSSNATNAAPKSPFAIPSAILGTRMALITYRSRRSLLRLNYRCQGKNVICATFSDAKKSRRQLLIARDGTPGWKTLSISDGNCASLWYLEGNSGIERLGYPPRPSKGRRASAALHAGPKPREGSIDGGATCLAGDIL